LDPSLDLVLDLVNNGHKAAFEREANSARRSHAPLQVAPPALNGSLRKGRSAA
jgi:hypothetical protein